MSRFYIKRRNKTKYLPVRITIRLERKTRDKLEILAKENDTTVSELVRSLIYKKLREEGLR